MADAPIKTIKDTYLDNLLDIQISNKYTKEFSTAWACAVQAYASIRIIVDPGKSKRESHSPKKQESDKEIHIAYHGKIFFQC